MQNRKTQPKGVLMLLLTAVIWGSAFVAQSVGMESVRALTFNGIRTLIGSVVLLPFVLAGLKKRKEEDPQKAKRMLRKTLFVAVPISLVFFSATTVQQIAFYYTASGKIAFITSLYMFFVALLGLFFGKRLSPVTWGCILAAFVGLYFLCFPAGEGLAGFGALNLGDLLALACAILFAIHILLVEHYADEIDGVLLSCLQFAFCGIISLIGMPIFEHPTWSAVRAAAVPILYAGILSCGVAYTFQILGQKYCEATIASLLMCLESVFAVLAAALILREFLSGRELAGCVLMFAAIIVSQLAEGRRERRRNKDFT